MFMMFFKKFKKFWTITMTWPKFKDFIQKANNFENAIEHNWWNNRQLDISKIYQFYVQILLYIPKYQLNNLFINIARLNWIFTIHNYFKAWSLAHNKPTLLSNTTAIGTNKFIVHKILIGHTQIFDKIHNTMSLLNPYINCK